MAETIDYTTANGQVRLLISDTDPNSLIFALGTAASPSDAVDAFLSMEGDNVKRAASSALKAIAVNEVLVQKRIKILDLSTDGPAEAKALLDLAKAYRAEADNDDVDGAFDWAEMSINQVQYDEITSR